MKTPEDTVKSCVKLRLRSDWASVQSDLSLSCTQSSFYHAITGSQYAVQVGEAVYSLEY